MEQYGPTGQVNFIFRDFPLAIHQTPTTPPPPPQHGQSNLFWRMHESSSTQNDWASLPTLLASSPIWRPVRRTPRPTACITSGSNESIQTSVAAGQSAGISSTPASVVKLCCDTHSGKKPSLPGWMPPGREARRKRRKRQQKARAAAALLGERRAATDPDRPAT